MRDHQDRLEMKLTCFAIVSAVPSQHRVVIYEVDWFQIVIESCLRRVYVDRRLFEPRTPRKH
jgi:hypothetical protein